MGMTQTTIYRNDATGYRVTLVDNGRGYAEVTDSLNYRFPMAGADYPFAAVLAASRAHLNGAVEVAAPAPAQMTSPLAVDAQVPASNLAAGAVLTMPTLPQARCLDWARNKSLSASVFRGRASSTGQTATLDQLQAMARRGWLELDRRVAPNRGTLTAAGRNALAAYVAKHGEVL